MSGCSLGDSQQAAIDKVVEKRADASSIRIPPISDYPAYRAMLSDLAEMKKHGSCIELITVPRDEWMAKILEHKAGGVPILALLGNLHALKKVDWDLEKPSSYVAEILTSLNYQVRTFPQAWQEETCNSHNRLLPPDSIDAVNFINSSIISLLNAYEYKVLDDVVDRVFYGRAGKIGVINN